MCWDCDDVLVGDVVVVDDDGKELSNKMGSSQYQHNTKDCHVFCDTISKDG